MDTLKLHSHFENLLYVGRSVLTNTSSRIQRLFFKKEMCIYEYLFSDALSGVPRFSPHFFFYMRTHYWYPQTERRKGLHLWCTIRR